MTRPYTGPESGPVVLGGRYELVELMGRGGMAEVHRATDRELGRVVAVKLLPEERRGDDTDAARLREEARAAAVVSHPHVVAVHDVGSSPHGVYVVMELLEGRTWADLLVAHGRVAEQEAARVGAAVASALAYAHEQGVVHRDVGPANIMLLADGTPKLMDFGIARLGDRGGLTETGHVVGTAAYMSPEQVRGEDLDGRSDVYSLGCTLYEQVTGRPPFTGAASADVAAQRLHEPPRPPRQLTPAMSVGMEALVLRMLAREPRDRPDAAEVATALEDLARPAAATDVLPGAGDPVGPVGSVGPGEPEDRPASPGLRRAGIVLLWLGVVALVVVAVLLAVR
ncbi:serine/threonine-protein kinase [Actinomycetospora sp. OC33-EN08]|uniref:non-specific serine/threonine protein kinase n=1 Tax=Actinomycetospora aurantiaca TaxID=3129233 RepID=A0ABU8MHV6_9PSEU